MEGGRTTKQGSLEGPNPSHTWGRGAPTLVSVDLPLLKKGATTTPNIYGGAAVDFGEATWREVMLTLLRRCVF